MGNLQICVNNSWVAICGNSSMANVLPVSCRALGFDNILAEQAKSIPATIIPVNQLAFGGALNCSGDEGSLMECQVMELEGSSEFFCPRPSDALRIACPGEKL